MTVNIKQVGNVVIIEGDSKEEFFKNSRNKVFFTSSGGFGFEVKKKGKKTIWEGIVEEEADLNEILTFIDKEKQKTKADSAIKKMTDNFLYSLTRLNQEFNLAQISLVGISNDVTFLENIDLNTIIDFFSLL